MSDEPVTILLVEDEDAIRLTLRDYLERRSYKVLVASDGVGAIKHLLDHSVDLIVTDYRMEILGGDYWVRFLTRFCPDTRVIITSGFLRPEISIPYEVVYKPFDYAELEHMIAERIKE
jgi:CheY-like chemotaxis protein